MARGETLDWTKLALVLKTMATERMEMSGDRVLRCDANGAAQERLIGELLRCIAQAIDASQSSSLDANYAQDNRKARLSAD